MKGKQLNSSSPEQIRESEKTDNLMDAIALFMKLDQEFTESEFEAIPNTKLNRVKSKRRLSPEQVFENGYQNKLKTNPDCSKRTFAKSEKYRISGILEMVFEKSSKAFYSDHETRELADEYVEYLDQIISGSITQENAKVDRTFNTELSVGQLKKLRLSLIEVEFISRVSENGFIYIFSGQPIKKNYVKIEWLRSINALRDLLERIQTPPISAKKVKSCFTKNGTPIKLTKPGRSKMDSSGKVYYSSDITKIENILGNL